MAGLRSARIIRGQGAQQYLLRFENGEEAAAGVRGIFRYKSRAQKPCVGDLVQAEATGDPLLPYTIVAFVEAKNKLERPPLANIDRLLLVFSLCEPELDLFLLDKMLVSSFARKIEPILVFTKIDLLPETVCLDKIRRLAEVYGKTGLELFFLDQRGGAQRAYHLARFAYFEEEELRGKAASMAGVDEGRLREKLTERAAQLRARTLQSGTYETCLEKIRAGMSGGVYALSGVSGSGKSTLFNHIAGEAWMETGAVSRKREKGKNTTRHVELKALPTGFLADTPGFERLEIERQIKSGEELEAAYPEMAGYRLLCRFLGCRHDKEPGCAVREGEGIDEERLRRYQILRKLTDEKTRY